MSQFLNNEKEKLNGISQTQFNANTNYFLTQISNDLSVVNLNVSNSINAPLATMSINNVNAVGTVNATTVNATNLNGGTIEAGTSETVGGGEIIVNGTLGPSRVYDGIYNPVPAPITPVGGWTVFFQEIPGVVDLPAVGNTAIFTIPLPVAMQNATKYTVRVLDMNFLLIQGSQLDRALIYFDYNVNRNGISYISGGAGQSSGCDNNFIMLDSAVGGSGSGIQTGTSFTNPATGPINAPIAPFSNNAFYAGASAPSGSYNPALASLNLPVFNIYNYDGDTGITNLYCVFNPDPNNGTQAVGSQAGGARLRCIVEASFATKY